MTDRRKPPENSTPDLSDLELSDIDVGGKTTPEAPRPREDSASEITDRQERNSQVEHLVIQEHLAAMPKPQVDVKVRSEPRAKEPSRSTFREIWAVFGGVGLVCVLFLSWVVYDRIQRPTPPPAVKETEAILARAVESFEKGDRATAQALVDEALRRDPDSVLAKSLAELFRKKK